MYELSKTDVVINPIFSRRRHNNFLSDRTATHVEYRSMSTQDPLQLERFSSNDNWPLSKMTRNALLRSYRAFWGSLRLWSGRGVRVSLAPRQKHHRMWRDALPFSIAPKQQGWRRVQNKTSPHSVHLILPFTTPSHSSSSHYRS